MRLINPDTNVEYDATRIDPSEVTFTNEKIECWALEKRQEILDWATVGGGAILRREGAEETKARCFFEEAVLISQRYRLCTRNYYVWFRDGFGAPSMLPPYVRIQLYAGGLEGSPGTWPLIRAGDATTRMQHLWPLNKVGYVAWRVCPSQNDFVYPVPPAATTLFGGTQLETEWFAAIPPSDDPSE